MHKMNLWPITPREQPAGKARSPRISWPVTVLLILPLMTHAVLMTVSVWLDGLNSFGRLDLVVFLLVIAYVCVAIVAVAANYAPQLLLTVYSTLIALVVVEGVLVVIFPSPPESVPWPPGRHVSTAGNAMPGISGTIEFTVNSLGLRGPEVRLQDVDLRILTLGGSTTELLYVTDELSWPWLLQHKLSRGLGKSVFVGNAGKSGHFTLHHDYQLNHYPLVSKFDWIVVLAGINDMGSILNRRDYERRASVVAKVALSPTYEGMAYYRRLAMLRLVTAAVLYADGSTTVVQDPAGDWYAVQRAKRQEALASRPIHDVPPLQEALETYRANLRTIIQTTRRLGKNLLMLTQPTMYQKDLPEHLAALLWLNNEDNAMSVDVLEQVMDAFNRTLVEVCREEGINYIDLASMLPKDTSAFYDDAHFNISGSEKVATIVADFFLAKFARGF